MYKQGSRKYPTNDIIWTIIYWYIKFLLQEINCRRDSIYDSRHRLKTRNRWVFGPWHVIDILDSGRLRIGAPVGCLLLL